LTNKICPLYREPICWWVFFLDKIKIFATLEKLGNKGYYLA